MILPIVGYGDPVLRKVGEDISADYPNLKELIFNMFDTMYNAYGIGLAAPQIGLPIRLFVIDMVPFSDDDDLSPEEQSKLKTCKKAFINAKILKEEGELWSFNEGCLSIPNVREDVTRYERITVQYQDEEFNVHTEVFDGITARVIQHEYDHIEGILFTDHLSPLKKKLLLKRLGNITQGAVQVDYKMSFPGGRKPRMI